MTHARCHNTDIETAKNLLPVVQGGRHGCAGRSKRVGVLVLVKGIQQGQFKPEQAKAALEKPSGPVKPGSLNSRTWPGVAADHGGGQV